MLGSYDEGKNKSIFVLARCLSPNIVKKGYIGLQYDNLKRLGLPTRPDSKTVKIYEVHWLRGILPYLVHHPNPLVRYQFWLSTTLAGFGILLALIGFSI